MQGQLQLRQICDAGAPVVACARDQDRACHPKSACKDSFHNHSFAVVFVLVTNQTEKLRNIISFDAPSVDCSPQKRHNYTGTNFSTM